jgi:hypothetical protein
MATRRPDDAQQWELNEIETEMLILAEENEGEIRLLDFMETGPFVMIGSGDERKEYRNPKDRSVRKAGLEALRELVFLNLVDQEEEHYFTLSETGEHLARYLKKEKITPRICADEPATISVAEYKRLLKIKNKIDPKGAPWPCGRRCAPTRRVHRLGATV